MRELQLWAAPDTLPVKRAEQRVPAIAEAAICLSKRDIRQIVSAFDAEAFEMLSSYVLRKALALLKTRIAKLGMSFVGEMLSRQDISEESSPTAAISDYEAISLARDLGLIKKIDATRLQQHLELLSHFDSLTPNEADEEEILQEEAIAILRTSVNAVLGRDEDYVPNEFVRFREELESKTFSSDDNYVQQLIMAPYFFKKTTVGVLLSNIYTKKGAAFEHTIGNIATIIPALWNELRDSEKWSTGQAYAEAVNEGNGAASKSLKLALTTHRGFDYVPENLRSAAFSAASAEVIRAHEGMNNFYSEGPAIRALGKLGSTIPWPAFHNCMTAIFVVVLGNPYGTSWSALPTAIELLEKLTANQWRYFVESCLPRDEAILNKIMTVEACAKRWIEVVQKLVPEDLEIKDKTVGDFIKASRADNIDEMRKKVKTLVSRIQSGK